MVSTEIFTVIIVCMTFLAVAICIAAWFLSEISQGPKDDWRLWRENCRIAGRAAAKRRQSFNSEEGDALLAPFEGGTRQYTPIKVL